MAERITYSQGVQVAGGPSMLKRAILSLEAYDVVNACIEAGTGPTPINAQPVGNGDVALLFITADQYADLAYATHAVIPATAGRHVSASSPSTDISLLGADAKLKIKADGELAFSEITVDATLLDSGAAIAAAIEGAIQALGGIYADVTFVYTTIYTCTSGTTGVASMIRINPGTSNDMCQLLKIGTAPV